MIPALSDALVVTAFSQSLLSFFLKKKGTVSVYPKSVRDFSFLFEKT